MTDKQEYPQWICSECGAKHGRRECVLATWHKGTCDACGQKKNVTDPRDFGHLKKGWENE